MSSLVAIGTAVPRYVYPQSTMGDFMAELLAPNDRDGQRMVRAVHRLTGIQQRYSVLPDYDPAHGKRTLFPDTPDFEPVPDTAARMGAYAREALPLAISAVQNLFDGQGMSIEAPTHLITVSCTGMAAPGLELQLPQALGWTTPIERYAVNFVGCYAAFHALRLADTLCRVHLRARVLIVCVELCSLHFQKAIDTDNLLANALFSDGAAAALVVAKGEEVHFAKKMPIRGHHQQVLVQGKADMAWRVGATGFLMTLTSYIPDLVASGIGELLTSVVAQNDLTPKDVAHWAIHPGGKRILDVCREALPGLTGRSHALAPSYETLAEYGNMSSATILFVLARLWEQAVEGPVVAVGFGPGLTMEAMVFEG